MKTKRLILFSLAIMALLLPRHGLAADDNKIAMSITASKQVVTMVEGRPQVSFIETDKADPGDTLKYDINYVNTSNEAAYNFAIVDPIPEGVTYLAENSPGTTKAMFSIDRGFSYHKPPLYYEIKNENGETTEKVAEPSMYSHIKWLFTEPIPPGEKGTVSFTARVK